MCETIDRGVAPTEFILKVENMKRLLTIACLFGALVATGAEAKEDEVVRVFIFAGQSNMVGSDSKAQDIQRFPPFAGLDTPQTGVRFSYCLGRENKTKSDGWVKLKPVNNIVGPELSFAREVTRTTNAPIAIIKVAVRCNQLRFLNRSC